MRITLRIEKSGMTLIEVMIFSTLLALLMTGALNALYSLASANEALSDDIEYVQTH